MHQFSRTELAIGKAGLAVIKNKKVTILGVGGVGSYAAESLVRAGLGHIILVDNDTIDITNVNRQIPATLETVGMSKCEVMKERMLSINPECRVEIKKMFLTYENYLEIFEDQPDYIIDAIDTISMKSAIIKEAIIKKVPIISSMGMANKLDVTQIKIIPLMNTKYDPIAKVLRKELREAKLSNNKVMVVCSEEMPIIPKDEINVEIADLSSEVRKKKMPPSSNSFVPAVAGLFCSNYVFNKIIEQSDILIDRKQ